MEREAVLQRYETFMAGDLSLSCSEIVELVRQLEIHDLYGERNMLLPVVLNHPDASDYDRGLAGITYWDQLRRGGYPATAHRGLLVIGRPSGIDLQIKWNQALAQCYLLFGLFREAIACQREICELSGDLSLDLQIFYLGSLIDSKRLADEDDEELAELEAKLDALASDFDSLPARAQVDYLRTKANLSAWEGCYEQGLMWSIRLFAATKSPRQRLGAAMNYLYCSSYLGLEAQDPDTEVAMLRYFGDNYADASLPGDTAVIRMQLNRVMPMLGN